MYFLKILVFRLFLTDTLSSLLLFENHLYAQIPAATSKQAANTLQYQYLLRVIYPYHAYLFMRYI